MNSSDLLSILPLIVLVLWACALLLVDIFFLRDRKDLTAILAALGLVAALVSVVAQAGQQRVAFGESSVEGSLLGRSREVLEPGDAVAGKRVCILFKRRVFGQWVDWDCPFLRLPKADGNRAWGVLLAVFVHD